jgi:pyruvate/2-oxoglutarate dehydrogenase complex dihydrolipoamide acyltransferase (E2) component
MTFDIHPFPSDRNVIVDSGYLAARRHIINGFLELDVTNARQILKTTSGKDGRPLSFTAFIVASYAQAIHAYPEVQAYRDLLGRLIVFHDVDVSTLVERVPGTVAILHTIRNAHTRSVRDISEEIRSVQTDPHPWGGLKRTAKIGARLPRFIRLLYMRIMMLRPEWIKQVGGTTIVTSYGMFGKRVGWGIGFLSVYTLGLGVAGIAEKPMAYKGSITLRECLHITLSFDHDIVDGAPATRFARTFAELVESAKALEDETS